MFSLCDEIARQVLRVKAQANDVAFRCLTVIFHANHGANDLYQRDATPMTDCDWQGATATATASSRKQCTVDDFVMNGQQAEIEDVKATEKTRLIRVRECKKAPHGAREPEDKDCHRELTPGEVELDMEAQKLSGTEEDSWIDVRVPN